MLLTKYVEEFFFTTGTEIYPKSFYLPSLIPEGSSNINRYEGLVDWSRVGARGAGAFPRLMSRLVAGSTVVRLTTSVSELRYCDGFGGTDLEKVFVKS